MDPTGHDAQLRQAAFDHVNRLAALRGGVLDAADLAGGFDFAGERIPLINPQRGIFKPRQMEHLLSIKTVFPRKGGRIWYDDQREVHQQIYAGDDVVDYAFMGTDPNSVDNRSGECRLRAAGPGSLHELHRSRRTERRYGAGGEDGNFVAASNDGVSRCPSRTT
jgi:hypothetical protein